MNSSLPATIYKYLPRQYAERLLSEGEVLFRSLAYFLACEDKRRDEFEGTHVYAPSGGLEITNRTQGWTRRIPLSEFRASAKNLDVLFVFCTSLELRPDLALKFGADACVEVMDLGRFVDRLKTAIRRDPRVKLKTLMHGEVEYYETGEPPGTVWPQPDRIVFNKPRSFTEEREFRFAFSLKPDAFDFENVEIKIAIGPTSKIEEGPLLQKKLKLGSMIDCCRPHYF